MDKVIYKNPDGRTLEFSASSKYKLINIDDLGGVDSVDRTVSSPFQDGATPVGQSYFNTRIISVEFATFSNTLVDDLREIDTILNPKLGPGEFHFTQNGNTRMLYPVKARKLPTRPRGKERNKTFQMSSFIIEAYDPYYQDLESIDAEVATGGNLFSFPLNITANYEFDYVNTAGVIVNNDGDIDTPVTVVFDGPKTAPLSIENLTTGERIVLSLDLLADERLTVTTGVENTNVIKENLTTGVKEVAFQYIDIAETTFFTLAKGENRIQIVTTEGIVQDATVKYKNKYVGV